MVGDEIAFKKELLRMPIAFWSCSFLSLLSAREVGRKSWHVAVFGNGGVLITEGANESGRNAKDKAQE